MRTRKAKKPWKKRKQGGGGKWEGREVTNGKRERRPKMVLKGQRFVSQQEPPNRRRVENLTEGRKKKKKKKKKDLSCPRPKETPETKTRAPTAEEKSKTGLGEDFKWKRSRKGRKELRRNKRGWAR